MPTPEIAQVLNEALPKAFGKDGSLLAENLGLEAEAAVAAARQCSFEGAISTLMDVSEKVGKVSRFLQLPFIANVDPQLGGRVANPEFFRARDVLEEYRGELLREITDALKSCTRASGL